MQTTKSGLWLALAAAVIGTAGCSSSQDTTMLPLATLDSPSPSQIVAGSVAAGGWAIDESGIERVGVYIDRKHVTDAQIGIPRSDVEKAYPQFASSTISGFLVVIPTKSYPKGYHDLVARIYAKDGATRDVGSVFIVTK